MSEEFKKRYDNLIDFIEDLYSTHDESQQVVYEDYLKLIRWLHSNEQLVEEILMEHEDE